MRLILHIGGAKCGSTAIQFYLRDNVDRLAEERGILVPGQELKVGENISGEQIFFWEKMRDRKEDGAAIVNRRLTQLYEHMRNTGLTTLILSAENLINPGGFEEFFVTAQSLFDINVVLYARRQDQYLVSAWQQWHLKTYDELSDYLGARLGQDANWLEMLNPWETALPNAKFTIRRFQRDTLLEGDVVTDFFHAAGLGPLLEDTCGKTRNRSFDESLGDIAHRNRDLFKGPHDNEFYEVMFRAIGSHAFKSTKGSHLFTLQERNDILAAYKESNQRLREKYFSDLDSSEPLFKPPSESEVIEMTEDEKRKAEIDLLARGLYNLTKRMHELEEKDK